MAYRLYYLTRKSIETVFLFLWQTISTGQLAFVTLARLAITFVVCITAVATTNAFTLQTVFVTSDNILIFLHIILGAVQNSFYLGISIIYHFFKNISCNHPRYFLLQFILVIELF